MTPFFSVVIPVYNAEKYINKCVESILQQSFEDFEIVLVNDGSIDRSMEICEELAQKDTRVAFFHQRNQGVSAARNKGISMAKGKYLVFVDADDHIRADTLKLLYENCNDCRTDICFFGYQCVVGSEIKQTVLPPKFCGEKSPDLLLELIEKNVFGLACNKAIKRDLIMENELLFDETIKVFEDEDLMMRVWNKASFVCSIEDALYFYVTSETSAMQGFQSSQSERYFSTHGVNLKKLESFMLENRINEENIESYLFRYTSSEIGNIIRLAGCGTTQEFKLFQQQLYKSELLKLFRKLYKNARPKSLKEKAFWVLSNHYVAFLMRWMSKLAEPLKIYPQVLENVRVTDKKAAQNDPAVQEAVKAVAEALGDTGRILVRESGTEPLVRVMVEAPDHDTCQKYVSQVVEAIKSRGYTV